jgi:hypothetical protein
MTVKIVNAETAVVSKKLLGVISEEEQRITDSGADAATVFESVLNSLIVALVLTFRKSGIRDDEALVKALRVFLRDYDERIGKVQPRQ